MKPPSASLVLPLLLAACGTPSYDCDSVGWVATDAGCVAPDAAGAMADANPPDSGPAGDADAAGMDADTARDTGPQVDANCARLRTYYEDADGDGKGDPEVSVEACSAPEGFVDTADDAQPRCPGDVGDGCETDAAQCHESEGHKRLVCQAEQNGCTYWREETCSASTPRCDPDDATCKPCASNEHCAGFPGALICDAESGQCVQCTREQKQACNNGGTQYICNPATHTCELDRPVASKTDCNKCVPGLDKDTCAALPSGCVSDDECQPGQACVDVPAGAGQRVCQSLFTGDGSCVPPYFKETETLTSADGAKVEVCTFSVASTTCQAHADYRTKRCGEPDPKAPDKNNDGIPDNDLPDTADNDLCGAEGVADGYCVWLSGPGQYRCTVPCFTEAEECPQDELINITCVETQHGNGTRNLCSLL